MYTTIFGITLRLPLVDLLLLQQQALKKRKVMITAEHRAGKGSESSSDISKTTKHRTEKADESCIYSDLS